MTNRAIPGWYPIAARALFGIFALLTSIYCLLAYIPDLYFAFIQAPFQPWLVKFIAWHPYLYWVTLAALGAGLLQTYSGVTRRMAIEFLGAHAILGVYFLIYRPFSHVRSDSLSFLWSLASLFPLLWIGTLDYCEHSQREGEGDFSAKLIQIPISAALMAGLAVALLDPASAWLRSEMAGRAFSFKAIDFAAWAWALLVHVLFALFAVCAFNTVGRLAEKLPFRFGLKLAYSLFAIVGFGFLFQRVLLASIPFTGVEAAIYSAAIAISVVAFTGGLLTSANAVREKKTALPGTWRDAPATQNAALVLVLLAAIYVIPALIGAMDWNSVLAKL